MNRALPQLLLYSMRGRLLRSARLLKQPRYLVGFLVFAAWLFFWVGRPLISVAFGSGRWSFLENVPVEWIRLGQLVVAAMMAFGVTIGWLLPGGKLSLGLTPAEIELLSSAPLRRRDVIQYSILKNQGGILIGCLVLSLLMGFVDLTARPAWFFVYWLTLSNWDLNSKGRNLFKARLGEVPPARAFRLRVLSFGILAIFWGLLGFSVAGPIRAFSDGLRAAIEQGTASELLTTFALQTQHGLPRWLLTPFVWLTEAGVATLGGATTAWSVVLSIAAALALVLVQNEWVVRSQFKFEESALEQARRESTKKDPRNRYRRISVRRRAQSPFALSPLGRPGIAILWKNMILVRRGSLMRNASVGALIALVAGVSPGLFGGPRWLLAVSLFFGFVVMAVGGFIAPLHPRNDLRTDLLRLEVLRPWPLSNATMFAYQALGPAVEGALWAGFGVVMIAAADLGARLGGFGGGPGIGSELDVAGPFLVPLLAIGLFPVVVGLATLTSVLINLITIYMPGWIHLGTQKPQAAAAFGHNLLVSVLLFFAGGISMLFSALLVGGFVLIQSLVLDLPLVSWELPVLGGLAAIPALGIAAVGARIGGHLWEGLDASREVLDQQA